jgi:hypothetical protein
MATVKRKRTRRAVTRKRVAARRVLRKQAPKREAPSRDTQGRFISRAEAERRDKLRVASKQRKEISRAKAKGKARKAFRPGAPNQPYRAPLPKRSRTTTAAITRKGKRVNTRHAQTRQLLAPFGQQAIVREVNVVRRFGEGQATGRWYARQMDLLLTSMLDDYSGQKVIAWNAGFSYRISLGDNPDGSPEWEKGRQAFGIPYRATVTELRNEAVSALEFFGDGAPHLSTQRHFYRYWIQTIFVGIRVKVASKPRKASNAKPRKQAKSRKGRRTTRHSR